jgi:hypothetical protein
MSVAESGRDTNSGRTSRGSISLTHLSWTLNFCVNIPAMKGCHENVEAETGSCCEHFSRFWTLGLLELSREQQCGGVVREILVSVHEKTWCIPGCLIDFHMRLEMQIARMKSEISDTASPRGNYCWLDSQFRVLLDDQCKTWPPMHA